MALKFKFKTKEEIRTEHLSLYAERDGTWLLDVNGAVDKSKLDEFRTTSPGGAEHGFQHEGTFGAGDSGDCGGLAGGSDQP